MSFAEHPRTSSSLIGFACSTAGGNQHCFAVALRVVVVVGNVGGCFAVGDSGCRWLLMVVLQ